MDAAVQEMFSAVHMQLLARACRLDKLLLAALLLETRASGDRALRNMLHPHRCIGGLLCERLGVRRRRMPLPIPEALDGWCASAPAAGGGCGCLRCPERSAAPRLHTRPTTQDQQGLSYSERRRGTPGL